MQSAIDQQRRLRQLRLGDDPDRQARPRAASTTGCYLFTLTGTDNVGNTAVLSTTVIVDPTPPRDADARLHRPQQRLLQQLDLARSSSARRPGGTYIVTASSSDADSGSPPATPATRSPRSPATASPGTQTGGQVSYTFGTTATQPTSAAHRRREQRGGGSSATASYTAILDSTAPAGGALTVNGVAASAGGDDELEHDRQLRRSTRAPTGARPRAPAASGLAASTLVRDQATLTNNVCGTFGSATTITGAPTQDAAAGIATGICYRYTLTRHRPGREHRDASARSSRSTRPRR